MSYRLIFRGGCLALVAALWSPVVIESNLSSADERLDFEIETVQQTLEVGLKARRPQDFKFIARVVQLVQMGRLPIEMIETTFHWSRRQHARYPFPYFEHGLRVRAQRIGIAI